MEIQPKVGAITLHLEKTDLAEQTYRILRDWIMKRQFKPGDKISAEEMAEKFGVSRTPVIVALQRLANEGLVEIIPQRGTFVTALTQRDVAELFEIRLMIELYAADQALATGRVSQFLDDARKPMARMKQAMSDGDYGDYDEFINADQDLHMALVFLTGNQRLIRLYQDLHVHIHVARAHYIDSVEKARQACVEHDAIADAFRNGQPDHVRRALASHIGTVKERILEILKQPGEKL